MSDKPETLDAILAEMRASSLSTVRAWADRIETAAERERDAHTNDIHDALYMATGIPGNAAAMRAALEEQLRYWNSHVRTRDEEEMRKRTEAALSSPARNCDRFATEDEAREAYWAYREPLEFNNKPFVAITEWLFAPAEGGAK